MNAFSSDLPTPRQVVAALRSAADASDGGIVLLPGISDNAMDAWEVPVPEDIRAIARETGGFAPVGWNGEPDRFEAFSFEHEFNAEPNHRCGPPGTFRVLHTNGAAETYYVDVDPDTGEWHGVFALWDSLNARFEAPSLAHWLLDLADGVRRAADAVRAGCYEDFDDAFSEWFFGQPADPDAEAVRGWADREELRLPGRPSSTRPPPAPPPTPSWPRPQPSSRTAPRSPTCAKPSVAPTSAPSTSPAWASTPRSAASTAAASSPPSPGTDPHPPWTCRGSAPPRQVHGGRYPPPTSKPLMRSARSAACSLPISSSSALAAPGAPGLPRSAPVPRTPPPCR